MDILLSTTLLKHTTRKRHIEDHVLIDNTEFPCILLKHQMLEYAKEARDEADGIMRLEEKGTIPPSKFREKDVASEVWKFARANVWVACNVIKNMKLRADYLKKVTTFTQQTLAEIKLECAGSGHVELTANLAETRGFLMELAQVGRTKLSPKFMDVMERDKLTHYQLIQIHSRKLYGKGFEELLNSQKMRVFVDIIQACQDDCSIGSKFSDTLTKSNYSEFVFVILGVIVWNCTSSTVVFRERLQFTWANLKLKHVFGQFLTELADKAKNGGLTLPTVSEKSAACEILAGGLLTNIAGAIISPSLKSHFDLTAKLLSYSFPPEMEQATITVVKFGMKDEASLLNH